MGGNQSKSYTGRIRDRVISFGRGSVFVPSDFKDIAGMETIKKVLQRLSGENLLRRVMRGVYDYPEYSDFLKEYIAPSPDRVARAIARNYGWTIVPFGETALNLLGLSSQVPAVWVYVSDGMYKEYVFNSTRIRFKRTTNKEITGISYKTALVIQALKALGSAYVDKHVIKTIAGKLSSEERQQLLTEGQYATAWIYESLKRIEKEGIEA